MLECSMLHRRVALDSVPRTEKAGRGGRGGEEGEEEGLEFSGTAGAFQHAGSPRLIPSLALWQQ